MNVTQPTQILGQARTLIADHRLKKADKAHHKASERTVNRSARVMAYLLLLAGTGATIAANIAHAHPNVGARALSAVIPVLLFGAFHVAAHDDRPIIVWGTGILSVVCFGISYDHISALAIRYGESRLSSVLYPLGIDGAMIVATFVLSRAQRTEGKPLSAPVDRVPQIVRPATVVRPVAHALSSDPKPGVLSATVEDKSPVEDKTPATVRKQPKTADNDARLTAAQEIADNLGRDKLTRAKLVEELAKRNFRIGTTDAAALTKELKAGQS